MTILERIKEYEKRIEDIKGCVFRDPQEENALLADLLLDILRELVRQRKNERSL